VAQKTLFTPNFNNRTTSVTDISSRAESAVETHGGASHRASRRRAAAIEAVSVNYRKCPTILTKVSGKKYRSINKIIHICRNVCGCQQKQKTKSKTTCPRARYEQNFYTGTHIPLLRGRFSEHDHWQNAVDDYSHQAVYHVCHTQGVLFSQLFGEIQQPVGQAGVRGGRAD
jgi:hypothetical protein